MPSVQLSYVLTSDGQVLVQVPDIDSKWGFYLTDDEQSWDGGFGIASDWEAIPEDDPRISAEVHEQLDSLFCSD